MFVGALVRRDGRLDGCPRRPPGRLLEEPRYIALAEAAVEPILKAYEKRGFLPRTLSPNAPAGVLADYAFFAEGLFDLFEATGDARWLGASRTLASEMVHRFYDEDAGGFFEAPPEATDLFLRRKDLSDGSEPSAAGRAATVLARFESLGVTLGHANALTDALAIAERWFAGAPQAVPSLLDAWDRRMRNGLTVVVASKAAKDETAQEMWSVVNASFTPHATVARVSRSSNRALSKYPVLEDKLRDQATAFVCFDGTCDAPTTDAKTLAKQLQSAVERAR